MDDASYVSDTECRKLEELKGLDEYDQEIISGVESGSIVDVTKRWGWIC